MIKNQLTIYRKFATQQILFEENTQNIEFPISSKITPEQITCSEPFTILPNHLIKIFPRLEIKQQREVIIHYPNIYWKSHYQLFKCSGVMKAYASITNESNFDFQTNDIKLVFRSMDNEYDPSQTGKNKEKDIPTFETKNILEYILLEKLSFDFILSKYSNLLISEQYLNLEEIYQINILNEYSNHADGYLVFQTNQILLPGTMEILLRTEMNDLICAGGMDIKLYQKNEKMKIFFPQNKFIKIKTSLTKKNHSFFLAKKQYHYECKIKYSRKNTSLVKIHFYLNNKGIQNYSIDPKYKEGNIYIWEKEKKHSLESSCSSHSHSHSHSYSHSHSHSHSHSKEEDDDNNQNNENIFELDFQKE
jgi:hypothetical protein